MEKSCSCECKAVSDDDDTMGQELGELPSPPMVIPTSSLDVSVKELFILSLFFILLLYAVISFLTQWNKNYREINYLPYYEIYNEETPPHSVIWDQERHSLNRTDSRVSRLMYNRASFSSIQSRRPQSCRVKSKYHPMSRHSSKKRSLSTSGFGQTLEELDEINMIDDETGEILIESGEKIKSPV